jgi:2-polyprenyl-3-methyl-5-hydroxy-6-metoxy-1,4-benzoquinol methylase
MKEINGYNYTSAACSLAHSYLLPAVSKILRRLNPEGEQRIFELGCGNGAMADKLQKQGYDIVGVDPSRAGVTQANQNYPNLIIHQGSSYDDLASKYGRFPIVLSLEVVEHIFSPRRYVNCLFNLCEKGGTVIISTPYHGYWKNLALALTGKLDTHFTALWDYGHIKFWSIKTLAILITEAGFRDIKFVRVGRIPPFAKTMIAIAKK